MRKMNKKNCTAGGEKEKPENVHCLILGVKSQLLW